MELPALGGHVDPADPRDLPRIGCVFAGVESGAPACQRCDARRSRAGHSCRGPRCVRRRARAPRRGGRAPRRARRAPSMNPSRSAATRCAELARRVAERETQLRGSRGRCRPRRRAASCTSRAPVRAATSASRASSASCPARHLLAEEQRRRVGQLVRLVEDHRVAGRQQLGEALVAQHHVGEEEMMVDDDDVGVERRLARLQHEAVAVMRAVRCRGNCRASTSRAARSSRSRGRRRARRGRRSRVARAKAMILCRCRASSRDGSRPSRGRRARDGGGRRSWRVP